MPIHAMVGAIVFGNAPQRGVGSPYTLTGQGFLGAHGPDHMGLAAAHGYYSTTGGII